eukprot:1156909-Rhodomonas_salina.5
MCRLVAAHETSVPFRLMNLRPCLIEEKGSTGICLPPRRKCRWIGFGQGYLRNPDCSRIRRIFPSRGISVQALQRSYRHTGLLQRDFGVYRHGRGSRDLRVALICRQSALSCCDGLVVSPHSKIIARERERTWHSLRQYRTPRSKSVGTKGHSQCDTGHCIAKASATREPEANAPF